MVIGSDRILVCNAGSSSLKLGLFDSATDEQMASESVDWRDEASVHGHAAALDQLLARIATRDIVAIGHRVVHGGTRYRRSVRVDPDVTREIARLGELAPLHNPAALAVIAAVTAVLPGLPQVAAFDTAFHADMQPTSYLYPVPYEWFDTWGLRRFGFHGLSHAYCAQRAAELVRRPEAELRLVTCHLGAGCSLAAVAGGRSVATTMGFTPLDGVMMATRAGAVDPGLLLYLLNHGLLDAAGLEDALQHESGLRGVSGLSGDMREILAAMAGGHRRARLAFDLYVARLREGIGAMAAAIEGIDALVFTAGVGEHAAEVRAAVAGRLGWLGVELDEVANAGAVPDVDVATPGARVRVLVIRAREELMVARETRHTLTS